MPEHHSWLNWIPGYGALEHWLHDFGPGWLFQNPVHAQHIAAMLLVILIMGGLALAARRGLAKAQDILPDKGLTARNMVELILETLLSIMQFTMTRQAALRHF